MRLLRAPYEGAADIAMRAFIEPAAHDLQNFW
jgi:hypothetical protein